MQSLRNREKENRQATRIGLYSFLVNLSLVGIKLTLSLITGSLALRADAIHSLVDVFSSIALILGLIISSRKSKQFPYGLYKIENVVSVIISLLLFFTAYEIVESAISGTEMIITYRWWVILVMAVVILIPFFFGRYEMNMGKKHSSPSLIADGSQFKADVFASTVVFAALVGQRFNLPLDRIAAVIVAAFIAYAAWGLLTSSMRVLLDATVGYETLEKIRSIVQAEPAVSTVGSLIARNSGRYIFVEATVTMRIADLVKAHLISEQIEKRIKEAVPNVDRVLIHYEPQKKTQLRYVVPLANREGQISDEFGTSAYFALVDIDNQKKILIRQEIISNPYLDIEKGRGIKVAEYLLSYKPDIIVTRESLLDKGPGYVFGDSGIELRQTNVEFMDELEDELLFGKNQSKY